MKVFARQLDRTWVKGLIPVVMLLVSACAAPPPPKETGLRVIDGDTFAMNGVKFRLIGYDAPESYRPQCERERRLGEAAKRRLDQILRGPGPFEIIPGKRDKYGRGPVSIVVDGQTIADMMIEAGLGRAYSGGPRESWC